MSKNTNDYDYLAAKQRVIAALSRGDYRAHVEREEKQSVSDPEPTETAFPLAVKPTEGRSLAPLQDSATIGGHVFATYIASRTSASTKRTMTFALRRAARLLGLGSPEIVPWHELRFIHTDAIRARLLDGTFARATVLLTLEALKGVLYQAKRMGLMTRDDFDEATDWDRVKNNALPAGRELPQGEIDSIQRYIAGVGGAYGAFLEAAFALMLGAGLRGIEVCRATLEAFDPNGYIKVLRKGDKPDELPLGPTEVDAINAWLVERKRFERRAPSPALLLRVQRNEWVRPAHPECSEKFLYRLCLNVARDAGIPTFTPHDLRRTFCTRALRISGDPLTVRTLMGHAKVETTQKYDKRELEERAAKRRAWNIWRAPAPANDD